MIWLRRGPPLRAALLYIRVFLSILSLMIKLAATKRETFGKKLKTERTAGRLPVVIYGAKQEPRSLFVSAADFKRVLAQAGESTIVTVATPEGNQDALIHEVAFDPIKDEPIHADFYIVDKTKKVEIEVPLSWVGVAPAVKDLGGTLVKVLHDLKMSVLPTEIPREIAVDISKLETLESQILVKDLAVPAGVEVKNEPDAVVAAIGVAKEEPVEETPADLSAIEVEQKGKKPEEGAGAEAAPPAEKSGEKKE